MTDIFRYIQMSKVSEMSVMRREAEVCASMPMIEYAIKYMNKIQDKCDGSIKTLQRMLRSVGEWDAAKVDKEYEKFLKWCDKRGTTIQFLHEHLYKFVSLSLHIMFSKRIPDELINEYQINIKNLFHKCMRRVARRLYEQQKTANDTDAYMSKKEATECVVSCLHEFIPIEKLIEIMELFEQESDSSHSYDFNRTFSDSEKGKILIEKNNETDDTKESGDESINLQLKYVQSDNFEDEYYNPDDQSKQKPEEDTNVKEINIPKYHKKGYYNKNQQIHKPKINEKDENFFSE